ncbi:MAG TPA: asparaginase [Vicinamibacterales bacterium]|nr:asparaginase [Vicinamibacterales bacterium]
MIPGRCVVEALRGDVVESSHVVHVAVFHAEQGLMASAGNPAHRSFVRSAIKMFQVMPFVEAGGVVHFGLTGEELALCTASHGGEPMHVAAARSILAKAKVTEAALVCGPHLPLHEPTAQAMIAAGEKPGRIHNNCSGKHAGMLACCVCQQWVTNGYHRPSHPLQQRIQSTLARWMRIDAGEIEQAVDGCGLPTFAVALDAAAEGCARFAAAAAEKATAAATIFDAMVAHPEFVAGTDRLDTDLIRAAGKRLIAKVGAEGFYCAAVPELKIGVALKVEDGARRAAEPALLAALHRMDALTDKELGDLEKYAQPKILNTRQEVVGRLRTSLVF